MLDTDDTATTRRVGRHIIEPGGPRTTDQLYLTGEWQQALKPSS